MAKYYKGDIVNNAIVFSPEGSQIFSGLRGKPSADMFEAECDSAGNLCGNHRPILLADLKRQEAAQKKLVAALQPRKSATSAVKRYFLNDSGQIVPFGTGPVTFDKWACQVMGSDDPTLVRENCTEAEFADWKRQQNYVDRTGSGSAGGPKLRDQLDQLRDQLDQQAAESKAREERLIALLEAQAQAAASTGKGKGSKAQPE